MAMMASVRLASVGPVSSATSSTSGSSALGAAFLAATFLAAAFFATFFPSPPVHPLTSVGSSRVRFLLKASYSVCSMCRVRPSQNPASMGVSLVASYRARILSEPTCMQASMMAPR